MLPILPFVPDPGYSNLYFVEDYHLQIPKHNDLLGVNFEGVSDRINFKVGPVHTYVCIFESSPFLSVLD